MWRGGPAQNTAGGHTEQFATALRKSTDCLETGTLLRGRAVTVLAGRPLLGAAQ